MRKVCELGRSMVEMLGVLAIIGVLSVGGIAGYSNAMLKYKLNKQAEQINQVINAVIRFTERAPHEAKSITTAQNYTTHLVKLGEIPDEMIKRDNDSYIYDVFNIAFNFVVYPIEKHQTLLHIYPDLTKKSQQNVEICKNILYLLKAHADTIESIGFVSNYQLDGAKSNAFYGDKKCTKNNICLRTMTVKQITDACHNHYDQESFWIDVWFRW